MPKERVVIGWSGGKDSSLALREILRGDQYEVAALLTTCTEGFRRISMHGVRCSLLKSQAQEVGLPLRKVFIARECSNAEYEARRQAALREFKGNGITKVVFGDLFLEEIRAYRDRMLAEIGMTAIYPIWGRNTRELAEEFIAAGFRAALVCIDPQKLALSFAGRVFDRALLGDLPPNVDPCGENGEFHTFVFDGPIFRNPVRIRPGPTVLRQNFYFADLLPASTNNKSKGQK